MVIGPAPSQKFPDVSTLAVDCHGRQALVVFHIRGELIDQMQIRWRNGSLESVQETDPATRNTNEMDARFFRLPELIVAGLPVSPSTRGCFYILDTHQTFRWQIELLDDHQQFVSLPAQGASRATAGSTVLQELNTLVERGAQE